MGGLVVVVDVVLRTHLSAQGGAALRGSTTTKSINNEAIARIMNARFIAPFFCLVFDCIFIISSRALFNSRNGLHE